MRLDFYAVKAVAERIAEDHAAGWAYFGEPIQNALIDAGVMAHVRAAWSADANKPFTATDLITFRECVTTVLAEGVGRGHRRRVLRVME